MRTFAVLALTGVLAVRTAAQPPEPPKLPVPTADLVKSLVEVLKDSDAEVRINAGNALAAIGAPAVDALSATLADPSRDARAAAAYALGQMGAEAAPAATALVRALKDVETDVRRQAAQALGRIVFAQRLQALTAQSPAATPPPPPPVFPTENP
jgi:HEAT repeat protein